MEDEDTKRDIHAFVIDQWKSKKFGGIGAPKLALRNRDIQGLLIHCTDGGERPGSAPGVCSWFDTIEYKDPKSGKMLKKGPGEAHVIADPGQIIQFADWNRVANHGNAANGWTIGLEICGKASQTREEWLDDLSVGALKRAAWVSAYLCKKFGIEVRKLQPQEILDIHGKKSQLTGFLGHVDVTQVLKSGSHYDPGPNFPWLEFLVAVQGYLSLG